MNLSKKIEEITPSVTLAITQKAQELRSNGVDVISFGAGEPDFDTPEPIKEAAKKALDDGFTKYAPAGGIPDLKVAISDYIQRMRDIKYSPDEIIVTCGAKAAIFTAIQVMTDPGDEIAILTPYWVSYPEQIKLAGGIPNIIETAEEDNFKITPEKLKNGITAKTKLIIINSPSNPVGNIYSADELYTILDICFSNGITVIADEIYDRLVYDGTFTSIINAHPSAHENTIYVNGVSKGYAMTGWRMGFAAGPANVIKAMTKYQGQLYTSITTFVQKACIEAFNAPESMISSMIEAFKTRRDLIVSLIDDIPDVTVIKPEGAFYAFVNIKNYFFTITVFLVISINYRLNIFNINFILTIKFDFYFYSFTFFIYFFIYFSINYPVSFSSTFRRSILSNLQYPTSHTRTTTTNFNRIFLSFSSFNNPANLYSPRSF